MQPRRQATEVPRVRKRGSMGGHLAGPAAFGRAGGGGRPPARKGYDAFFLTTSPTRRRVTEGSCPTAPSERGMRRIRSFSPPFAKRAFVAPVSRPSVTSSATTVSHGSTAANIRHLPTLAAQRGFSRLVASHAHGDWSDERACAAGPCSDAAGSTIWCCFRQAGELSRR
jgi:hypothetical protein